MFLDPSPMPFNAMTFKQGGPSGKGSVFFDPTCNLKCKTCGPHDSTLWQKEKGIKIPINNKNKNYLDNIDKKALKKVYLAGGEPTYIKGYHTFLEDLYNENPSCEVIINSNLKKLSEKKKQNFSENQ